MTGYRDRLSRLQRAGRGGLRSMDPEAWDVLSARVRWLYRHTHESERLRWAKVSHMPADLEKPAAERRNYDRRQARTLEYFQELGLRSMGRILFQDVGAARALWELCYEFTMLWELKNGDADKLDYEAGRPTI